MRHRDVTRVSTVKLDGLASIAKLITGHREPLMKIFRHRTHAGAHEAG